MSLLLVGLNHETAPLAARERVAYSPEDAVAVLRSLKEHRQIEQAFLLSTCNRTEIYALAPDAEAMMGRIKEILFYSRLKAENGNGESFLYDRLGSDVVHHLFRVSCGLDSMVLGEQEILGQVKHAYEISRNAETLGTVFHRLAHQALHVGKRARSETRIGYGPVSVAFAAVELAEKVFQSLNQRGALLVGAGENGALCAEHLLARGIDPLFIANRTLERAEALAQKLGGETVAMDRLVETMARVDIVVTTTGASGAVIDAEMVREAMQERDGKALVFIDVAVPRDVDPEVDKVGNAFRFDIEALKTIVDQSIARRRKEVPTVENLVKAEVQGFMDWWESLASGPLIRDLHESFESVRAFEMNRNLKRFDPKDHEQLDVFTRNLIRKLLMGVTKEVKKYPANDPVAMERLAALRKAFGLEKTLGGEEEESDET